MTLSAPVFHLKRRARVISRQLGIPLTTALDRIAIEEGFNSWSLLIARATTRSKPSEILDQLGPGDLLLLGARPGHGKTLLSLELLVETMKSGSRGVFFTLEYNENDVKNRFNQITDDVDAILDRFEFDNSDTINANYIIDKMCTAPPGTMVVIDYLQLLDQKRNNPELMEQIRALKTFARIRGLIIVCITQIDRAFELSGKPYPGLEDVRLPNPLDLKLFNKTCFLNHGQVQFEAVC